MHALVTKHQVTCIVAVADLHAPDPLWQTDQTSLERKRSNTSGWAISMVSLSVLMLIFLVILNC